LFQRLGFKAEYLQLAFLPELNQVYVGVEFKNQNKNIDPFDRIDYYKLGALVFRNLEKTKLTAFQIEKNLAKNQLTSQNLINFILGLWQASWFFDAYLDQQKSPKKDLAISLSSQFSKLLTSFDQKLLFSLNSGISLTREIIDETPEYFNPQTAAKIITDHLKKFSRIKIKLFDHLKLEKMGMQGISFVGRASQHKPILAHLILSPSKQRKKTICLVGKGLTYDSGGLDLKVQGYMKTMKMDMSGAATIFGIMLALANLNLTQTEVHWISPFCENMIGPNSYKADDIIITYSGQSVEVYNTDAEGRLTLSDALTYATLQNPDYIIDLATLTGSAIQAVSEYYAALMGNDQKLINSLSRTFISQGEMIVHTPLPEVLRPTVKGKITDLVNTSTYERAGHLTAGLFLSHFINQKLFRNKKLPIKKPRNFSWAHLDIAGSAFNEAKNSLLSTGATGYGIKSLVYWILNQDKA